MALLTNARLADTEPDVCGRKVTLNGMDCPGAKVAGNEIPFRINSALVLLADEIVTDEPLALKLPVKDAVDPVVILPKFSAEGVNSNVPAESAVPDKGILSCESVALDSTARLAEVVPETVAVNMMGKVRL